MEKNNEYHQFVQLVDDFLKKKEKAEKYETSLYMHDMRIAERDIKIHIQSFMMTNNPEKSKSKKKQPDFKFNFLAL